MQLQTRELINLAIQRALETNPVADNIAEEIREFQKTGLVDTQPTLVWRDNTQFHGTIDLHVNGVTIPMNDLQLHSRIELSQSKPYQLVGKGGASVALTARQTLDVIAEWLRFTLPSEPIRWNYESATLTMNVEGTP